jgi:hypothetical protein
MRVVIEATVRDAQQQRTFVAVLSHRLQLLTGVGSDSAICAAKVVYM